MLHNGQDNGQEGHTQCQSAGEHGKLATGEGNGVGRIPSIYNSYLCGEIMYLLFGCVISGFAPFMGYRQVCKANCTLIHEL